MYYLLSHNIMSKPNLTQQKKESIINNTFLLALDGDIDFQPKAVLHLVSLMKRNPNLGAACGRIHPVGSDGAGSKFKNDLGKMRRQ
jgi:chitin synthase